MARFLGVLQLYELGTPLDLLTQSFDRIDPFFSRFSICGDNKDKEGRSVMWINGGLTQVEDESRLIRTSCLMFLACHADLVTLRDGITMCIDTSTALEEKVGNERKLQETWQAYPVRPQHFFISASRGIPSAMLHQRELICSCVLAFCCSRCVADEKTVHQRVAQGGCDFFFVQSHTKNPFCRGR